MKKYLFIVLLVGVVFGQDVYPYFSDMAKQLEFEKKRIIIEEGESTQQIITGGGSEFNLWSLVLDSEPEYKTAPIKTTYRYNSYSNIQRNSKDISEIEMLRVIGLDDEADRIISEFEKEILLYNESPLDTSISNWYYYKFISYNALIIPMNIWLTVFALSTLTESGNGIILPMTAFIVSRYLHHWNFDNLSQLAPEDYYIIEKIMSKPILQQQLNTAQTKSMVEAYNRKLYSDIAKK